MMTPLQDVLLDTAYAMPAEWPAAQEGDDKADQTTAKEEKTWEELSRYTMLDGG